MYVSITRLKPKGLFAYFQFWKHAIPSFQQAKIAHGNLHCSVKKISGYQCSLTAWENREKMLEYMRSGAHVKALKAFHKIATGKTYGFETTHIPTWEEAFKLLQENGKNY